MLNHLLGCEAIEVTENGARVFWRNTEYPVVFCDLQTQLDKLMASELLFRDPFQGHACFPGESKESASSAMRRANDLAL